MRVRAFFAGAAVLAAGCEPGSPRWAKLPFGADQTTLARGDAVLVAPFLNSSTTLMQEQGAGDTAARLFADALAKRGLRAGPAPELASDASVVVTDHASAADATLHRIAVTHPEAAWLVVGRIIEFGHVTHRPEDLSRWNDTRHKEEAVASMELQVIDLAAERIVARETFSGRAWANAPSTKGSSSKSAETPGSAQRVAFDAATLRDTPLGLAARDAVRFGADRVAELTRPQPRVQPRILARDARRLKLTSDANALDPGAVLQVCTYDASGVKLAPVIDPLTRQPLLAKITDTGLGGSGRSAWLLGEPPQGVDLRGAVLCSASGDSSG